MEKKETRKGMTRDLVDDRGDKYDECPERLGAKKA